MITNSREDNLPSKLEQAAAAPPATPVDHHGKLASKAAASSSSSAAAGATATSWLRLKDPRIVRVSRAFGGKDRHSKVCTIRGLRDRRVRLSVSTAIQLYDLQDRLGLNQPSKVVDWLLNAAKDEIDELPPLPIPSASLGLNYQSMLPHTRTITHPQRSEFKINCNGSIVNREAGDEEANDQDQKQDKNNNNNNNPSSSTRTNSSHPSSFSSLLNNNVTSAPPFGYHWEPSHLPSSHHMGGHGFEDLHNFNNVNLSNLPSPLSLSTGSHIFLSPPALTQSLEIDPRSLQVNNHLQMLSSTSQNFLLNNSLTPPPPPPLHSINQPAIRPFHFSMAPKFLSQQKINNNNGDQANKDDEFGSDE